MKVALFLKRVGFCRLRGSAAESHTLEVNLQLPPMRRRPAGNSMSISPPTGPLRGVEGAREILREKLRRAKLEAGAVRCASEGFGLV